MRRIIVVIIAVLLFVPILAGCEKHAPVNFPQHIMFNYTARNLGDLFPCGCRIPLGGLSRRGGVLKQESPYPQLIVDAGNFVSGNTGYDRFAGTYILKSYVEMGYHAVNLGEKESIQTIEQIKSWDELTGGLLISSNLVDADGNPITRSWLIAEIGGIKIGITGITAERDIPDTAVGLPERIDPVEPLLTVIDGLKREHVDFIVLLADEPETELNRIIAAVPGIDLVVQGDEFVSSRTPEVYTLAGKTRLVNIGGNGKYLGRLRLDFDTAGAVTGQEVMTVELDAFLPTLSSISILLTDFKKELRDRRSEFIGDPANPFQRSQAPELIDVLSGYTGESFCVRCHNGYDYEERSTGHNEAWDMLDAESNNKAECLACHTTGYGIPTGLSDPFRDSHLAAVTCEACHGPAGKHVRDMTAIQKGLDPSEMLEYVDETGIPFTKEVSEEVCRRCHTPEWSPEFDYDVWIGLVKHSAAERNPGVPPAITEPE